MLRPFFLILGIAGLLYGGWRLSAERKLPVDFRATKTALAIEDEGLFSEGINSQAGTVAAFLAERNIAVGEHDFVSPPPETRLRPGDRIVIRRSKSVALEFEDRKLSVRTTARDAESLLAEQDVTVHEDDFLLPAGNPVLRDGARLVLVRVVVSEESVDKPIDFKTVTKEDGEMSWRKKIVTQKGEKGIRRLTYRVVRHDGDEVSRKLLTSEVAKEPVEEIVTQGTYVKTGKSHKGQASWYAWTGTMAAANPWLPKGSYVRVTNQANGKSVIVVINDRGPFVPGRIIDLDKVAFEKIASLGAGVIDIKMEEIVN